MMRGVGKDATKMFMDVHSWVNVDRMLDRYCIGYCEFDFFLIF
jgi:hypothetical protein